MAGISGTSGTSRPLTHTHRMTHTHNHTQKDRHTHKQTKKPTLGQWNSERYCTNSTENIKKVANVNSSNPGLGKHPCQVD